MGDEKTKRLKPKNKPYKKQKFDYKIFLKRSSNNSLIEDIENIIDSFPDYLNDETGERKK